MLINVDQPEECRAVVIENGLLDEIIVEHSSHEHVKGNIYLGVVTRVEPSIEAAFVDIGRKKYGFLPFKDVLPESYLQTGERKARTRIQDVMVRGQRLLVQVVKESRDAKGPSLTNAVTIPGRFLVLMVSSDSSGISRKIEDESERKKIKQLMSDLGVPTSMGVIIRTAGVGRTKTELQKDIQALLKIWETIEQQFDDSNTKAPSLLYEGPDMVVRTVRDHFSNDMTEVLVDNKESFDALNEFMKLVMPRMRTRIKFHQDTKPLFSQHNIEQQIESIYHRRVELPSGGSIVIDVGEAMVSIDVNSGRTTGASALEETAIKTNMEAADEICRQLRLRDLGGLIVIDFIDMFQKKNKALLEKQVKLSCKRDRARVNLSRISRFGLLEMSRQRLAPPVKEGFFSDCQHCSGTGHVKTDSSAALSVIRRIQEHLAVGNVKVLQVKTSTQVANYLLNNKMKTLLDLKEKSGVEVLFESQQYLPFENFSFTVLERKKEEDRVIEQKSGIQRNSRTDGEGSSEENGDRRGRGRRPSTGRGRGRRPASAGRERSPEEDKIMEQKASAFIGPRPEGEASPEENGDRRGRGRRPSTGRGRGRRPASAGRGRKTEEDRALEPKTSAFIGPKPEGEASPEESGEQRGRARRPSTGRSRGRRPASAGRGRKTEEDRALEPKTSAFIGPKPEGEASPEESGDQRGQGRRPSTGRGRGRRPGGRPGTRRPARSPRSRADSSRTKEDASTPTENKSSDAQLPRENISPAKESSSSTPPRPKVTREKESNEDRQPMENVSRLHEVVIKNRPPFGSGPNRK
jgi:ribonuclease E